MANEKRLIDAYELRTQFDDIPPFIGMTGGCVQQYIDKAPTVDAVEVVHGRWIPVIDEPTPLRSSAMLVGYECSVCGRFEDEEEPYCNCGAKMDGDGNG